MELEDFGPLRIRFGYFTRGGVLVCFLKRAKEVKRVSVCPNINMAAEDVAIVEKKHNITFNDVDEKYTTTTNLILSGKHIWNHKYKTLK